MKKGININNIKFFDPDKVGKEDADELKELLYGDKDDEDDDD